jgi:hypothetical protein
MAADWKMKYQEIRGKLKEATDVAWRLGYERGMKDGTQQAQMQQMAQMQQQQAAMMGGGQPGQPGAPGQDPMAGGDPMAQGAAGGMPPGAEEGGDDAQMGMGAPDEAGGEEAGGGSELDNHINELQSLVSKGQKPSVVDIRKVVDNLAGIRKHQKDSWAKKVNKIVPAQKKVVDSILKKWETESKRPSSEIEAIIKEHGLKIDTE